MRLFECVVRVMEPKAAACSRGQAEFICSSFSSSSSWTVTQDFSARTLFCLLKKKETRCSFTPLPRIVVSRLSLAEHDCAKARRRRELCGGDGRGGSIPPKSCRVHVNALRDLGSTTAPSPTFTRSSWQTLPVPPSPPSGVCVGRGEGPGNSTPIFTQQLINHLKSGASYSEQAHPNTS
jgi:hypothetical protein